MMKLIKYLLIFSLSLTLMTSCSKEGDDFGIDDNITLSGDCDRGMIEYESNTICEGGYYSIIYPKHYWFFGVASDMKTITVVYDEYTDELTIDFTDFDNLTDPYGELDTEGKFTVSGNKITFDTDTVDGFVKMD